MFFKHIQFLNRFDRANILIRKINTRIVSCLVELKASSSAEDAQQWWSEIFGIKTKMKPLLVFIFLIKIFARSNLFSKEEFLFILLNYKAENGYISTGPGGQKNTHQVGYISIISLF